MAFDHETAETIAPVLAMIGQESRLDPNWTCHMLEAVAGQVLPDFHRRQRNKATCNADRIRHGERVIANATPAIDDFVQLSHAYAAEECLIEASYRISKAIELQPDNGELRRFKASILERMARFEEALQAAIEARNLGADAESISFDVERIEARLVCHLTEVSSCLDTAVSLPASMKLLCMGRLTFPEFIKFIGKIVRAYANKN
jgi:hypothetical protein